MRRFLPAFVLVLTSSIAILATAPMASAVTAQMGGAIDRQGEPSASSPYFPAPIDDYILHDAANGKAKTTWAQLQPTQGGPIASNNAIDAAIAHVRGTGVRLKVRIYAGTDAPEWAKNLPVTSGARGPVSLCNYHSTTVMCGTAPHFWESNFQAAYADLQTKLAAKYDGVPEIAEVSVSSCTAIFAEPMIREGDGENLTSYINAGYSESGNRACMENALQSHAQSWKQTRSAFAFNPYQEYNASLRKFVINENVTESVMDRCRALLADRCVIGNHSVGKSNTVNVPSASVTQAQACAATTAADWTTRANYTRMYYKIKCLGKPIYFQTDTAVRLAEDFPSATGGSALSNTLKWAASMGAAMVELPSGYSNATGPYAGAVYLTPAQLTPLDAALEANALPATAAPIPPAPTLAPPTSVSATAGNASATVRWTASAGAASYVVRHKPRSTSTWTDFTPTSATSLTIGSLTNGVAYDFQVRAVDAAGNKSEFAPDAYVTATPVAPPAAPSNLAAALSGSGTTQKITLSWRDNSSTETKFELQRATNSTFTSGLTTYTLAANATSYANTGLARTTTYYYRVVAINGSGRSASSNTVSKRTL